MQIDRGIVGADLSLRLPADPPFFREDIVNRVIADGSSKTPLELPAPMDGCGLAWTATLDFAADVVPGPLD